VGDSEEETAANPEIDRIESTRPGPTPMKPVAFEIRRLSRLAAPLVTAQVGAMSLWVVDMIMLGQVSVEALDAASLGRLWLIGTSVVIMGFLLGLDPLAAQAYGAGDRRALVLSGQRGLVAAAMITPLLVLIVVSTGRGLVLLGQDPHLSAEAHRYALMQIAGLPCFFGYVVLRHWLQAQGRMKPVMWATLSSNLVNVAANWIFIFGHLGSPPLGVAGAGLASAISMVYMMAFLGLAARLLGSASVWRGWSRESFHLPSIARLLGLGAPVGAQMGLEYWAFSVSMIWAGWLGAEALAAHSIVVAVTSFTFMLPLGVSFAAVTRVGNLVGGRDLSGAQRAAWVALGLGSGLMTLCAVGLVLGRRPLSELFTDDPAVVALCAAVLPITAAFQVADGAQVVGSGVLRGMGRTLPAALIMLIGFYGVALPLAWWLGLRNGAGLVGIWSGLALGLTVVALLLVAWIHKRGPARM
jgi:multidrug resistance protein, MATE family